MSLYLGTDLISGGTKITLETFVDAFYPVGSIFIGTTSTCPLAAIKGTWTLKSSGKVLQGADSNHAAGTSIAAGLPNITGVCSGMFSGATTTGAGGALYKEGNSYAGLSTNTDNNNSQLGFNASRSNSIYGNSTTVQPPAYVVNIWERTA